MGEVPRKTSGLHEPGYVPDGWSTSYGASVGVVRAQRWQLCLAARKLHPVLCQESDQRRNHRTLHAETWHRRCVGTTWFFLLVSTSQKKSLQASWVVRKPLFNQPRKDRSGCSFRRSPRFRLALQLYQLLVRDDGRSLRLRRHHLVLLQA